VRHDQGGLLHLLDDGGNGEGLAGAGRAEQHLVFHSVVHAVHETADGFGLVAHGLEGGLKFEFHGLLLW
jgi:hypothetical protein